MRAPSGDEVDVNEIFENDNSNFEIDTEQYFATIDLIQKNRRTNLIDKHDEPLNERAKR